MYTYNCMRCKTCPKESECKTTRGGPHGIGDTLCWCCENAVPTPETYCPWMDDDIPVPEWDARIEYKNGKKIYNVRDCPLFIRG